MAFLLVAVVIAVIGTLVVVMSNRAPSRPDSAMAEFEREMRALAPRPPAPLPDRRTSAGAAPVDEEPRSDVVSDER